MADKPGKGITRRDFISMGIGGVLGYGLFGATHWRRLVEDAQDPNGSHRGAFLSHRAQPTGLTTPHDQLKDHYDIVVVGSGYGGAILAARLAARNRKLCVLERGREWAPGDFPANAFQLARAARLPLNPLGLFDANIQLGNDMDVLVACGLGGGSLINGAIAMRPEPLCFELKEWPTALRAQNGVVPLDPYFAKVEQMLATLTDPQPSNSMLVGEHRKLMGERGIPFGLTHLNVNTRFRGGSHNDYGVPQNACIGCGDCVTGCNVGAKNTLAMNYLPYARARGAEIFAGMEVRSIEKDVRTSSYRVRYVYHAGGVSLPIEGALTAANVILSAGSLGSTEILLRSQADGLRFSQTLGSRFSANADIVGFAYNGLARTDVAGFGAGGRAGGGEPVGQTIASYGDYRTGDRPLSERFIFFAGTVPSPMVDSTMRGLGVFALLKPGQNTKDQLGRIRSDLESLRTNPNGALDHSTLYLACGYDSGEGRLALADKGQGRVNVIWPGSGREHCFAAITAEMEACAKAQGALFVADPHAKIFSDERQLTVHPLGGCPMGDDVESGTVDHRGCVFDPDGTFHRGLYVADGAIVPRSLGVPPLLTISALAERIAENVAPLFPT